MTDAHYLNAVVERGKSFQLITEEYSPDAIRHVLQRDPEAIALAPAGALDATRLLATFTRLAPVMTKRSRTPHTLRWRCYWQSTTERNLRFCGELDDERNVTREIEALLQSVDRIIVLISYKVLAAANRSRQVAVNFDDALESVIAEAIIPSSAVGSEPARPSDREQLRDVRNELLKKVASFTSEDLAAGGDSMSDNASQYALDLRSSGKVFGVRFGRVWRYPKFQFDPSRRPHPEMRQVLAALSPDSKGWDRLQWFVTPHEHLKGKTPLHVWRSDRTKVVEAANMEQWHGRRD